MLIFDNCHPFFEFCATQKKSPHKSVLQCLLMALVVLSGYANALDKDAEWLYIETEHFRFYYEPQDAELAQELSRIAEKVHHDLSPIINWQPKQKTEVILDDGFDLANGFARVFPYNLIHLRTIPPREGELIAYDNWLELLFLHEYTHILHLDKASGLPLLGRKVLGRFIPLFPNLFQPNWLLEGFATYHESQFEAGLGRGQSSFFSMKMRVETLNGLKSLSQINSSHSHWPIDTAYLYGVHFYQYVEQKYGSEAVRTFIESYSDNAVPYLIAANGRKAFGKSLKKVWKDFDQAVTEHYQQQVNSLKQQPLVEGLILTDSGYWTGGPEIDAADNVYYLQHSADKHPAIHYFNASQLQIAQAGGQVSSQKWVNVNSGASLRAHPTQPGVLLVAQPELCRNDSQFYDLYVYSQTGKKQRLTRCSRYHTAVWTQDGQAIIALKHVGTRPQLDLLNAEGQYVKTLWQGHLGEVVNQFDLAPDNNRLVVSIKRPERRWRLELFDISTQQWTVLNDVEHAYALSPRFSANGDAVLFSSDRDGVYNIYEYHLKTRAQHKLTHVLGGGFAPIKTSHGDLFYRLYGARGYNLAALSTSQLTQLKQSVRHGTVVSQPSSKDDLSLAVNSTTHERNQADSESVEPIVTLFNGFKSHDERQFAELQAPEVVEPHVEGKHSEHKYKPWNSLIPRYWYPTLEFDSDTQRLGVFTSSADVLGRHAYSTNIIYDTDAQALLGFLSYSYKQRWSALASRSLSRFQFDEANAHLREYTNSLQLFRSFQRLRQSHRHTLSLGVALEEREQELEIGENVLALPDRRSVDHSIGVVWLYSDADFYAHSLGLTDGRQIRFAAERYLEEDDSVFRGSVLTLGWQELVDLGKSRVLTLSFAQGLGFDSPEVFALGGFDNHGDYGSTGLQLGLRDFSLRGYPEGLSVLRGRRMQMLGAELHLPLNRIERHWLFPPIGLQHHLINFFIDSGTVWNDGYEPGTYRTGVGVEWVTEAGLLFNQTLQSRLGFASGLDREFGENTVYFRLSTSF